MNEGYDAANTAADSTPYGTFEDASGNDDAGRAADTAPAVVPIVARRGTAPVVLRRARTMSFGSVTEVWIGSPDLDIETVATDTDTSSRTGSKDVSEACLDDDDEALVEEEAVLKDLHSRSTARDNRRSKLSATANVGAVPERELGSMQNSRIFRRRTSKDSPLSGEKDMQALISSTCSTSSSELPNILLERGATI
jgi:hypothetical protein